MTLAASKTCLIDTVTNSDFAVLNFVTTDLTSRITAATTFRELYHIIVEMNGISASLPELLSSTGSCTGTEIETNYLGNAAGLLTVDVTATSTSIGSTASLTTVTQANIVSAINELRAQITPSSTITALSTLTTTAQTSLVSAINELQAGIKSTAGTVALSTLTTAVKTSLVAAISEVQAGIKSTAGTVALSTLTTTAKTSLVEAISEVQAGIKSTAGTVALSTLTTTDKTSLVAAINELQAGMKSTAGTVALTTLTTDVKTSLVAAINEVNTAKYAFSLALCGNTASLRKQTGGSSSPAATLAADLANIFVISNQLIGGSSGETASECLPRLQCIMKSGSSTFCAADVLANIEDDPSCDDYIVDPRSWTKIN